MIFSSIFDIKILCKIPHPRFIFVSNLPSHINLTCPPPSLLLNILEFLGVSGVGGNLVAVQASRLSTALHQASQPGILPPDAPQGKCPNPCTTFFGKGKL